MLKLMQSKLTLLNSSATVSALEILILYSNIPWKCQETDQNVRSSHANLLLLSSIGFLAVTSFDRHHRIKTQPYLVSIVQYISFL